MSDLVYLLRTHVADEGLMEDAADEIERLRQALTWIETEDRYWTSLPNGNEVLEKSITGNKLIRGIYGRRAYAALPPADRQVTRDTEASQS